MDTAMRDLDQIRERGSEGGRGGRQIAVIGLAALAAVGLVFAVGVVIGDASEAGEPPEQDPLASLEQSAGLAAAEPGAEGSQGRQREAQQPPSPEVDPSALTFPEALRETDDEGSGPTEAAGDARPEVAAALAAAEAELAHPDPLPSREAHRAASETGARVRRGDDVGAALPAAVAAGSEGQVLARTVERDPLVASSIPTEPAAKPAQRGREGKYTLQVISYRTPEEAEAFAEGLRSRGHRAFVVSADIPDRGRHWRVRIGPFEHKHEVEDYRAEFEQKERMNTYIVKREED